MLKHFLDTFSNELVIHYRKIHGCSNLVALFLGLGSACIEKNSSNNVILLPDTNSLLDVFSNALIVHNRKIYEYLNLIAQVIVI